MKTKQKPAITAIATMLLATLVACSETSGNEIKYTLSVWFYFNIFSFTHSVKVLRQKIAQKSPKFLHIRSLLSAFC